MLRHSITIALRSFLRHRTSFLINLLSLTAGLSSALLILLWINDEWRFDRFHRDGERLYQVFQQRSAENGGSTTAFSPGPMATALKQEIPEVEAASVLVWWFDQMSVARDNQSYKSTGYYAGADFFKLFNYPLIAGSAEAVLKQKNAIVISETAAVNLFGSIDRAMGQLVEVDRQSSLPVTGIFADVPPQSSQQFDFVIPFEHFTDSPRFGLFNQWNVMGPSTFVKLKPGTDNVSTTSKINQLVAAHVDEMNFQFILQPYQETYLYNKYENGRLVGGRITYVRMFSLIGILILLVACINFMNISTAHAARRTKEVGIKKTMGAQRSALIIQYLMESTTIALLALLFSLGLVFLLLPRFNLLTGKEMVLELSWTWMIYFSSITLITGILAGSYPAFYLSSFKPVTAVKGFLKSSSVELWVRRSLVVFQYTVSVMLIVAVLVIYQQVAYFQNEDLGYEKEQLIEIILNIGEREKIGTFLEEAQRIPGVVNISSGNSPVNLQNRTSLEWEGSDPEQAIPFNFFRAHYGLLETMEVSLKEGRFFSREFGAEENKVLLNETAIAAMGIQAPVGKMVRQDDEELEIIGVVKDFHFQSLHQVINPIFIRLLPNASPQLIARISARKQQAALLGLENLYRKFNPGVAFDYQFIDRQYAQLYAGEQQVSTLSQYFAGFAILISCLGLFGLALYTTERRKKEIGIRKVLGASVSSIVVLLTGNFVKLVFAAILLGLPISYFMARNWLNQFAYSIDLTASFFLLSGGLVLSVALLTVSFQALRSASINPTESLQNE